MFSKAINAIALKNALTVTDAKSQYGDVENFESHKLE